MPEEVQKDHFDDFFLPKLDESGYQAHFSRKNKGIGEGCAIFFRKNLFSLHKIDAVALILGLEVKIYNLGVENLGKGHHLVVVYTVLKSVERFVSGMSTGSGLPMLVCGDFGIIPRRPPRAFVTLGEYEFQGSWLAHCLNLKPILN
ncbi:hypothetical protein OROMI_005587 [Orobanche minor]